MRATVLTLLTAAALLLNASCEKEEDLISRRYPCRFYFYSDQHPTSLLLSAYKSAGLWVTVRTEGDGYSKQRHIYVQPNTANAETEDNPIRTDLERQAPYLLGANSQTGLIAGRTNFNGPWAYDRTCPNCEGWMPLTWTKTNRQHVSCNNCQREYDLETGAVVSGQKGSGLLRYYFRWEGNLVRIYN